MGMCPRCDNQALVSYSLAQLGIQELTGKYQHVTGLVVEQCNGCHGLFLDAARTVPAIGAAGDLLAIEGASLIGDRCRSCDKIAAPGATHCASCNASLGLTCPSCKSSMSLAKVMRVEVDVCRSCDALWFDDGELSKIHRRFRRRKARGAAAEEDEQPLDEKPAKAPEPLPTVTCIKCKTEGFRLRDVYKTKEGHICRPCMGGKEASDGRGLSVGFMNDGGLVSGTVDAMVTLAVVDAIFDLFRD